MGDLHMVRSRIPAPVDTGIYVRAKNPEGKWESADISQLSRQSLTDWLKSRGGDNPWAESVVLTLLGHG